jgi:serine/threonine protein kinase
MSYHPDTKKFYALKRLRHTREWPAVCYELHAIKEVQTVVHLYNMNEPAILQCYALEYDSIRNEYFFVFEYGRGTLSTLKDCVEQDHLKWADLPLVDFVKDLVDQVDLLKSHNLYHRDIKPENVIITDDWKLKLFDYSCAAKVEGPGKKKLGISGTAYYMAPEIREVWEKGKIIAEYVPYRADIFSIAMTFMSSFAEDGEDNNDRFSKIKMHFSTELFQVLYELYHLRETKFPNSNRECPKLEAISEDF